MTWLRLDDVFPEHPKVATLSDAAFRAHVQGMAYCAQHLTDGFIPARKAKEIAGDSLAELTRKSRYGEPLWVLSDGEYEVHDYLAYNPSRADVEATREQMSERGKKGADARWDSGKHGSKHSEKHGSDDACEMPRTRSLSLDPDPNTQTQEEATAATGEKPVKPYATLPACMSADSVTPPPEYAFIGRHKLGASLISYAAWRWPHTFKGPTTRPEDLNDFRACVTDGCFPDCPQSKKQREHCYTTIREAITDPRMEGTTWPKKRALFRRIVANTTQRGDRQWQGD